MNFQRLLQRASIWSSGPNISPSVLNFDEDSIWVSQYGEDLSRGVIIVADTDYFEEYEAIGEAKLPVGEIVNDLKKHYGGDETIDVDIGDGKITMSGKNDNFESTLDSEVDVEISENKPDDDAMPTQLEVVKSYKIAIESLKDMCGMDVEQLTFNYNDNLEVTASWERGEHRKIIESKKEEGNGDGEISVRVDLLKGALSQFSGNCWVHFTDAGKFLISASKPNINWCYAIANVEA